MNEWIINRIKEIIDGVSGLSDEGATILKGPAEFNSALYQGVLSIMENGVMPVAYVLLGLIFMIELYNITVRTEGMYNAGFEIPFKTMFKLIVCKMVVDSTPLIMGAIYEISETIMSGIGTAFSSGAAEVVLDMAVVTQVIEDMDFATRLLTAVQVFMIWLIFKFAYIAMLIIIVGRMVEIYVYLAIAPLPIATIPNSETSGIAKNFVKSFAAVCIQGVLIFIVLSMYGELTAAIAGTATYTDFTDALLQATMYALVLVVALFMTGKWSKSIMNAA